jgi:hypothetical protein
MPHEPQLAAFAGACIVTVAAKAEIKTEDAKAIFRLDEKFITPPWIIKWIIKSRTHQLLRRIGVTHATWNSETINI